MSQRLTALALLALFSLFGCASHTQTAHPTFAVGVTVDLYGRPCNQTLPLHLTATYTAPDSKGHLVVSGGLQRTRRLSMADVNELRKWVESTKALSATNDQWCMHCYQWTITVIADGRQNSYKVSRTHTDQAPEVFKLLTRFAGYENLSLSTPRKSDDAIIETLVRLAVQDHDAIFRGRNLYFLEIAQHDPPDSLLAKLNLPGAVFKKASSCRRVQEPRVPVILYNYLDNATKERGVLVSVSIEEWENDDTIVASYSWDESSLSAHILTVRMRRTHDEWTIIETLWNIQS